MLSDEWIKDVRDAPDDMRIRLLDHDFESAIKEDVPLAIDLLVRAQYFWLVLDEKPADTASIPDAGTLMESLQLTSHPVRVLVLDIPNSKQLLRLRTQAAAEVLGPGADPKTSQAIQRQANSCAIAAAVRKALGDQDTP